MSGYTCLTSHLFIFHLRCNFVTCFELSVFNNKFVNTMSKRSSGDVKMEDSLLKKPKHWSLGLLDSMNDPKFKVIENEHLAVIRDKYPKAKIHYLVLPHEEIGSIYNLAQKHLDLLKEFGKIYEEIQQRHSEHKLNAGFHAMPSMARLHMHVISNDMISPCMKTKVHWNSFTTNFFIPYKDILKELQENGVIDPAHSECKSTYKSLPLECNQCSFKPKNMPQLKEHLLSH